MGGGGWGGRGVQSVSFLSVAVGWSADFVTSCLLLPSLHHFAYTCRLGLGFHRAVTSARTSRQQNVVMYCITKLGTVFTHNKFHV